MKSRIRSAAVIFTSALISLSMCGCIIVAPPTAGKQAEEKEKTEAGKKYTADFNGHSYEFVAEDLPWEEARVAAINRGGHLATITSAEEQEFIEGLFYKINGDGGGPWIGAYSDGAYDGDKYDWCWVTGEKWNYTNWANGQPDNDKSEEWYVHFFKDMKWNDLEDEDAENLQYGYLCEYDDLSDVYEVAYVPDADESFFDGGEIVDGGEDVDEEYYYDESDDWQASLNDASQAEEESDPFYKDLGDGRTAIQSKWRGVQIKYPSSFYAAEDGDALYVFDGDSMYVYARNITTEAYDHSGDLAAYCAAKAEELAISDFTKLFGMPTGTDRVQKRGGDGESRICDIKGNMWNETADIWFKSKVFISGKNNDYVVCFTAFWRLDDQVGSDHYDQVKVTSWGIGEMYQQ